MQYWASVPTEEFGQKLSSKLETCAQALNESEHLSQVRTAFVHYYGRDIEGVGASANQVARSGAQGELAEVRVPAVRALANGVLQIVTGPKLAWSAEPINNDHDARATALTGGMVIEAIWKQKQVGSYTNQAALDAIRFGEGFIFNPWDPSAGDEVAVSRTSLVKTGDVAFTCVPTWDVIRDPTYKSFDALPWIAVTLYPNRYDIAGTFPEKAKEILGKGSDGKRWTLSETAIETDCVAVTYWFHKRTPGLPHGRESVIMEGGLLLSDNPLHPAHHKLLPVHRLASGELTGTPYPDANFWKALGIQQVSDSLHTSITTNITTTATPMVAIRSTSNLTPYNFGGSGLKILPLGPGDEAPIPIQIPQVNGESFKYLQVLDQKAQQLLGLNATTLGQPEGANLSGAAMALLSSMSIQANSSLQSAYVDFVARIGNSTLSQIQYRMPVERKISLAGSGRAGLVKSTSYSGKMMRSLDKVCVTIGNPLQQTAAGRLELAQLMIAAMANSKQPLSIQQIEAVVETGRTDPLTQNLSNQLLLIQEENELLAKGENPPVSLFDNHSLHISENPAPMSSMEARLNDKVFKAVRDHVDEHIRILKETDPATLAALGQQSLAPPPQPPPPPAAPPQPPQRDINPQIQFFEQVARGDVDHDPKQIDAQKWLAKAPPLSGPPQVLGPPMDQAGDLPSMPKNPATGEHAGPVAGTSPVVATKTPKKK